MRALTRPGWILNRWIHVGFAFAGLLGSQTTMAEWNFQPSVQVKLGANDNTRLSPDEEDAVLSTGTLQGELTNSTEKLNVGFVGGVGITDYSGTDTIQDKSREEFFFDFEAQRSLQRGTIGLTADLRRQDLLRRVAVLGEDVSPGGEEILTDDAESLDDDLVTGIESEFATVESLVYRDVYSIAPDFSFSLTPRWSIGARYSYSVENFENAVGDFQDSETSGVQLSVIHQLTERDGLSFGLLWSEFEPDDFSESKTHGFNVAWKRQVSQRFALDLRMGARRTERGSDDQTGLIARFYLDYRLDAGRIFGLAERTFSPNAFGEVIENDTIRIGVRRPVSPRVSWSFDLRAVSIDSDTRPGIIDRSQDLIRVGPSLRWRFTESLTANFGYSYTWVDRERLEDSLSGNEFSVSFRYFPR